MDVLLVDALGAADGAVDPLLERAQFVPGAGNDACLLAFVLCQRTGALGVEMVDVVDHQPAGGDRLMPPHVVGLVHQATRGQLASAREVVRAGWASPPSGGEPVARLVPIGQTSLPAHAWR